MSKILLIATFGLLFSCNSSNSERQSIVVYKEGAQQLNLNLTDQFGESIDPVVVIRTGKDTVQAGEPVKFRMYFNSNEYELLQAYFECSINNSSFVDTVTTQIATCSNRLPVRKDSVIIEFTAGVPGPHNFLDLTLLSRDSEGIFRYHNATFDYFSTE